MVSVQVVPTMQGAVLLIIRQSWVRAPPAPSSLNRDNVRNIVTISRSRDGQLEKIENTGAHAVPPPMV
jgi:hypothetical protein